jgi:Dyp-type peroxidase family
VSDEPLDLHDIQGLVLRGFGSLFAARFLLLEVVNDQRAREYLQALCTRLNLARDSPEDNALQVAFTAQGLARLGVPKSALATFSREFLEGMDDDIRAETLGDRGDNDPSTWQWGRQSEPVHVLLMIYASDDATLMAYLATEREALVGGFRILHEKETTSLVGQKEHFGFRDGLSMPKITGVPQEKPRKKEAEWWTAPLPAGEFVLGYRNDYGAFTESPTVEPVHDPANHLPVDADGTRKSLGRNGTYLVHREMRQDVPAFWNYLATRSREVGDDPAERAIALGAKMVGRWPGGAPLATSWTSDDPEHATDNKFLYEEDLVGVHCPPGAHIRRANPRDVLAFEERGAPASKSMVRKHQMIRRGRAFGRPVAETMDPRDILAAPPDDERRGLHFICLVGDINRQFEFVQRAWIHSANFDSLYKDGDPLSAARRPPGHENPNNEFTCPAKPVRRKYKEMPQFTRLVGGAYFFLPGIAALKFISRHP